MNEELLQTIYEAGEFEANGIPYDKFKKDMRNKEPLRRSVYKKLDFEGNGISYSKYRNDLGLTSPDGEKNYFDLGILNDTMVGDWIDDMGRAISRGNKSGDTINETISVMLSGSAVTPENLQEFIDVTNEAGEVGQSEEMSNFLDKGGFNTWEGWGSFASNMGTIIPEAIVESAAGMFGNTVTGSIVGAGAATSAATGGATAVVAMPVALGLASGTLETTSKFTELLREEVEQSGGEFNQEGVRAVLEDEETMKRITKKSLARGITIGALDAITGKISSSVGAKVVGRGLSTAGKVKKVGKGIGIEMAGGAGGEFAAQVVAGEPLDVTSIGLEAFAEIGSGAPNVLTPIIKDSWATYRGKPVEGQPVRQTDEEGQPVTALDVDIDGLDPVYKINGQSVSRDEMDSMITDNLDEIVKGNINVEVKNDEDLIGKIDLGLEAYGIEVDQDTQTETTTDEETTTGTDPEQGLEPTDTQTTEGDDVATDQGDVQEEQETVEGQDVEPTDVPTEQGDQTIEESQITEQDGEETTRVDSRPTEEGATDQGVEETTGTEEQTETPQNEERRSLEGIPVEDQTDFELLSEIDRLEETNQSQNNEYYENLIRERNRREGIDNNQNLQEDETSERESIQGREEDNETTDTDPTQVANEGRENADELQPREEGREEGNEILTSEQLDERDETDVRREEQPTRPDEPTVPEKAKPTSRYTYRKVKEVEGKVDNLIKAGKTFDEAFDEVKGDYVASGNVREGKLKISILAEKNKRVDADNDKYNTNDPYFDVNLSNWNKFKNWYRKKVLPRLRSSGALTQEQFEILEKKRGYIQRHVDRANTLAKKITRLTRDFSEYDRRGVDDMLRGASSDVLTDNVDTKTREQLNIITKELRDTIDGLSTRMENLGVLSESQIESIRDNKGKYINRIYARRIDADNWKSQVPKQIVDNIKKYYRDEFTKKINDGRVSDANKAKMREWLSSDAKMDDFLRQLLTADPKGLRTGGMEGTKDTSITKFRKDMPDVLLDFLGEVRRADVNALNTITKMASFIGNTEMLENLQKIGFRDEFISDIPRTDPDGQQWVEVNKSGSDGLTPLDAPVYVKPEVAEMLALRREQLPKWVERSLIFNGLIKSGKTVFSPVTQVRNFVSAGFWMAANGNWNPQNFNEARALIMNARKVAGVSKKGGINKAASALLGDMTIEEANAKWARLVELQVANQNVVARELNDFLKSISGKNFDEVLGSKRAATWLKKAKENPQQFYADVDDFYRLSYYINQEKVYAKALFNKKPGELNANQRVEVEEQAARIVRDTYPNYSKIYPIVSDLRKFPFMGAFVSFSAEMIRTTRNQFVTMIREAQSGNARLRVNALKRGIGLSATTFVTGFVPQLVSAAYGFGEEEQEDAKQFRPPWVESMILLEDLGGGQFTYMNPATINPYGYFGEIVDAARNEGGLTRKGMAMAIMKTFEPFVGPEVSVEVMANALLDVWDEDNPDTNAEKMVDAALEIAEGLQPGLTYTLGRIAYPGSGITAEELEENPDIISEKRRNELLSLFTGMRRSELNVPLSFEINKGKEILKDKRKARKDFNTTYYKQINAPETDRDAIDRQYEESVRIYNNFLDEARENASRMRRLGIPEKKLKEMHKSYGVRFDGTGFTNKELEYVFGQVDYKPILRFKDYNDEVTGGRFGGNRSSRFNRRRQRRFGN